MGSVDGPAVSSTYVHPEGSVCLACSPDGRCLYSGGADGVVRCFDLAQASAGATTIEFHEDGVTSLDCSRDHLASCSESGQVALHDHSASCDLPCPFRRLVTRSLLPSRCVRFSPDQKSLAVSSDELVVKVLSVHDPLHCYLLVGHAKPVRSLCWSPDSNHLISSGCEGVMRLWDLSAPISQDQDTCLQVFEDVIPTILPEENKSIQPVWHPSGKYFLAPARERGMALFARESPESLWKRIKTVGHSTAQGSQTHSKPLTASAFSQNGRYLATGCEDGLVIIWDVLTWQGLAHQQPEPGDAITAIQWSPKANTLLFANCRGQIVTCQGVIPVGHVAPFTTPLLGAPSSLAGHSELVNGELGQPQMGLDGLDDLSAYGDENWVIDDLSTVPQPNQHGSDPQKSHAALQSSSHPLKLHSQRPFQPGATQPCRAANAAPDAGRRYMAFNTLGFVHLREREEENLITVEFHDRGKRKGYHFADKFKFHLSSVGGRGVAFACNGTKSGTELSSVRYDPFENWSSGYSTLESMAPMGIDEEASWQYELPEGENVTSLACGGSLPEVEDHNLDGLTGCGVIAVGTDKGYIRILAGSGIQTHIWNLGQEIVALACSHEFLLVVYRSSISPLSHALHYCLMDVMTFEVIQEGLMPLAKEETVLTWIGFSHPHLVPACYDSSGVLSFLDRSRRPRQGRWVPVLDTASLKAEGQRNRVYWPVGVSATELSCIILKGGSTQPSFPTPLVQEVLLQMPALRLDQLQGQLEECFLRESMIHHQEEDLADPDDYSTKAKLSIAQLELDKKLLKLIESCCKVDPSPELQKALDYAAALKNLNTLEACIKICKFFNLAGLSDRVAKLYESKQLQSGVGGLQKRQSKYSHLEDYSVIPKSTLTANRAGQKSDSDLFDKPFESTSLGNHTRKILNREGIFTKPVPVRRKAEEEFQSDDWKEEGVSELNSDFPSTADEPGPEDASSPQATKRPRLSTLYLGRETEIRPKGSTNPFAKKPSQPPTSGVTNSSGDPSFATTNPFSSKRATSQSAGVTKTGLFFERVDEHNGVKKPLNDAKLRQSTIGDVPVKNPSIEGVKKARKRKGEPVDSEGAQDATATKVLQDKSIKSFLCGPSGKQMKVLSATSHFSPVDEESQISDSLPPPRPNQDESQQSLSSIDFSQSLPPRIRSTLPEILTPSDSEKENPAFTDHANRSKKGQDTPTGTKNSKLEAFRSKADCA